MYSTPTFPDYISCEVLYAFNVKYIYFSLLNVGWECFVQELGFFMCFQEAEFLRLKREKQVKWKNNYS